jgi:hypothetical protein
MSSSETTQTKQSINFAELEKPIQDIITLVEKFDEKYRQKCFEVLLDFYLHKEFQLATEPKLSKEAEEQKGEKEFIIPIDVRAFLQTYEVPEETIGKLFLIEKNEIRPIYKITTTMKSEAQIQLALLAALENAVQKQGNKFEFSIKNVRERCQKHNVYDSPNFKAHFKNNTKFFKSLDDEEHVELSPEGQTELAEVISTVTK